MPYNEEQLHSVYTSLCHIMHGIARINVPEVQAWIREQTKPDIDKPGAKETIDKLMTALESIHRVHETLRQTGLPPVPRPKGKPAPRPGAGQHGTA